MRFLRFMALLSLLLPVVLSCNKDLNVNAEWRDITVVYGLLDQSRDTTFIKITKAFLGEGDALQFSKVPDSSTYPDKLDVWLVVYSQAALIDSLRCDTITIHNKQAGDSTFYYPDQLMYFTRTKLNENYSYKLYIKNRKSGKEITSQTVLVRDFEIAMPNGNISFPPGKTFRVKWTTAKNGNGKRYQLLIRFYYQEALKIKPDSLYLKSVDWTLFSDIQPTDASISQQFDLYFPSDNFYTLVGRKIDSSYLVSRRVAHHCQFIFSVAAPELNTYIDVTKPSLSLVQERPAYTNIVNGIGLFSARFTKSVDTLGVSDLTKKELKVNPATLHLGF
ncbi:MAG: hypothetical protein Q8M08_03830 [Bacteroidales bacterium]|nr:hypothetical protein [Bacteroidales bacterium]